MTTTHSDDRPGLGPLDARLLDRLVDGELMPAARRELLARLDTEPDGWRRCALAFLEAQTWRQELGPLAASANRPPAAQGTAKGRSRGLPRVRSLAAVAALFLAAFVLGWVAHSGIPVRSIAGVDHLNPTSMPDVPGPVIAATSTRPVVPQSRPHERATPASSLPESFVRAWERCGYQVEQSRRTLSMELEDGRRLPLPIDEVRLRYVGDRTY